MLTGKSAPAELRMTVFAASAESAAKRYTSTVKKVDDAWSMRDSRSVIMVLPTTHGWTLTNDVVEQRQL